MLITRLRELLRQNSFGLPHRKSFLQDAFAADIPRRSAIPSSLMNARRFPGCTCTILLLAAVVLTQNSCRKAKTAVAENTQAAPVIALELESNGLDALPGAVCRSQAGSPIHWQPWTKDTLNRAKAARRLVFCVIAMPRQPVFLQVLSGLESDPAVVDTINSQYVPVLVDGDAARELSLLTADLCLEIRRPVQMPLLLWLTHEGNPVAWLPSSAPTPAGIVELFNQSHSMVSQMWREDAQGPDAKSGAGYVVRNSALDNANRRERMQRRKTTNAVSSQPALDAQRSLRQLASMYDSYSRTLDESGLLFPDGTIDLLASAAARPGLPADVRDRCMESLRGLLDDLLPSAMFDPLDGGVFSARRGPTWDLPWFVRDCVGQARVAVALVEAFHVTGDRRALDRALGSIAFAEKNYATEAGLFAAGLAPEADASAWLWSVEDVEQVLGKEDARWWISATGMKGLGNLPSEADPRREFFRANSLSMAGSPAEIAASLGQSEEAFLPRFESAKAKMLAARRARLGDFIRDASPHAESSLRMVSAYAAAFAATGDDAWRTKAVELLKRTREAFAAGPRLRAYDREAAPSIGAGRAFLYALALQSVLDVAAITLDEQWFLWSEDLATTAAEMFTGKGFLKECPDEAKLIDLPVTDLVMLFGDSTAGLVASAEARLSDLGRPLVASFSELATPLPLYAIDRPMLHTDLLGATLLRHFRVSVLMGKDLPAALAATVSRLPVRTVTRRSALPAEDVPPGAVKVLLPEGKEAVVTSPEELQQALLPSP